MLLKLVTAGPIRMPSIIVSEAHTRAEVLCAFCEATPAKKAYQPSASAACKICVLARPVCPSCPSPTSCEAHNGQDPQRRLSFLATRSVSSLAAHAVKKTDAAIMNGQEHLPSSEVVHALHTFERCEF
jgi:adenine-specific DNA glycosylase